MTTTASQSPAPVNRHIPPLQNGDRLTREEFERRFDATPDLRKAELIEGRVYVPPPTSFDNHSNPHAHLIVLLGTYSSRTPGVRVGDAGSIRLDLDNMPQPDACLLILPTHGGQARISDDDYIEGAPELVAEIAATSASYDLHDKLHVYRRNGVREYIVWRTFDAEIDIFVLQQSQYIRASLPDDGIHRSGVFPGLWIARSHLLRGEMDQALAVLQRGLADEQHRQFVQSLQRPKQS